MSLSFVSEIPAVIMPRTREGAYTVCVYGSSSGEQLDDLEERRTAVVVALEWKAAKWDMEGPQQSI